MLDTVMLHKTSAIRTDRCVWRSAPTIADDHKLDEPLLKKLFKRDDHTCQFCGFQSNEGMEPYHHNDDHSNNHIENLLTACGFCHASQHLGYVAETKSASLIYLPEIDQYELNSILRAIYLVQLSGTLSEINNVVEDILDFVYMRRDVADELIGDQESIVSLSKILRPLKDQHREGMLEPLKDFRIMHKCTSLFGSSATYRKLASTWLFDTYGFGRVKTDNWHTHFQKLTN